MSARRLFAIGLVGWGIVSGCQASKTTSANCTSFASAQELCASTHCDTTWTAVESNPAYCGSCNSNSTCTVGDCGDYHVVSCFALDTGGSYYYRRDTGALVAGLFLAPPSPTDICYVVATETFSSPSCNSSTFSTPGWCSSDAGAAGQCSDGSAP